MSLLTLTNTGQIVGSLQQGVYVEGSNEIIRNMGTISDQSFGMFLNGTAGSSSTVVNSGKIIGDSDAFYSSGGGYLTFRNTGSLDGGVQLGDSVNTFVNAGTVQGDVHLGNVGNTFDSHRGEVTGTIFGGNAADTIRAGNDGETLGGGKGHDRLVGGAGPDTFQFASFSAADTDVVRQFDVAQDLIQLDSSVFTHLKSEHPPTFSIGTTASSATDFLFYNATRGGLYYDADGSGTAHPAYLVATFDAGLKLTTSNFSVG